MTATLNGIPNSDLGTATADSIDITGNDSVELIGDATTWTDLRVPLSATRRGSSRRPSFDKTLDNGSGSQGVFGLHFDSSTEEEVYFEVQMPHEWKLGSTLKPHIHWMPSANGSAGQKVSWGMEYSFQKIGETFANTTIIYGDTTIPDETLVADRHYLTELGEIDASGIDSVSAMFTCRIFRDATGAGGTDSYTSDAVLLEFDFHFEVDSFGSRTEYTK
ncbi:MAG: hypothetical protein DSY80_06260 [Desulfocapsa sp.]|nr:MAG: hypothetical protein DSY80_06260 [Desulfocapsa sp.]